MHGMQSRRLSGCRLFSCETWKANESSHKARFELNVSFVPIRHKIGWQSLAPLSLHIFHSTSPRIDFYSKFMNNHKRQRTVLRARWNIAFLLALLPIMCTRDYFRANYQQLFNRYLSPKNVIQFSMCFIKIVLSGKLSAKRAHVAIFIALFINVCTLAYAALKSIKFFLFYLLKNSEALFAHFSSEGHKNL